MDDFKIQSPLLAKAKGASILQNPSRDINKSNTTKITETTFQHGKTQGGRKKKKGNNKNRTPAWMSCSAVKMDGVELIQVSNNTSSARERIYCFILTDSSRRENVKAVTQTWGPKCDYLLISSNASDPELNAVEMKAEPTYENLWNKLNETMHYISRTSNQFKDYDWYFKVDTDSFVVMENLHAFLESSEVQEKKRQELPLIYGRRFAYPEYRELKDRYLGETFFWKRNQANRAFGERFFRKVANASSRLVYPSGGAGYIMNQQFASKLLDTLESDDTLYGIPDEDMAVGINMLYQGVITQPSLDSQGRQLFHPELPRVMYNLPSETADWLIDNHKEIGGIQKGASCCSPFSITFHHAVQPIMLRHLYYRVYECNKRNSRGRGEVQSN